MVALLVIVAMLGVLGIPPSVIIFFGVVTYFIWRAVRHTEHQETGRIFEFYKDANDILREEERRWYGFELAEVIDMGERVLHSMTDAPPLVHFALGALYHHAGGYQSAVEHLSYLVEDEQSAERTRVSPSPELRRYVHILRKLEREPAEAPQTMAAIRSLERARRTRAEMLLTESREKLKVTPMLTQKHAPAAASLETGSSNNDSAQRPAPVRLPGAYAAPPPIAEVLRDVYEEEKKTA